MLRKIIKIDIAWLVVFMSCLVARCARIKRVVGGSYVECDKIIQDVEEQAVFSRLQHHAHTSTQPRFASLRNASTGQHLCGATLLTPEFASTAAHCVRVNAKYMLQLDNFCEDPPRAQVLEVIQHELYDKYSRAHDIALLRIEPLYLAGFNESMLPKYTFGLTGDCKVYGYGVENTATNELSGKLLEANVRTVSLDDCTDLLGQYIAPTYDSGMMCALGNDVDTCEGDSGGPLVCDGLVEGISSYGVGCAVPGVPAIYTSVRAHLAWIQGIVLPKIKPL